jgi:hypothetical protein
MYLCQIDEVYLCGILFIVKATFTKCRPVAETSAGILEQSMGARNQVGTE